MKKIFTLIIGITLTLSAKSQFTVNYENSFRNWMPGQGWVMINNDTIPTSPGLITQSYNTEVLEYMLGVNTITGLADKIMFSPAIIMGDTPRLLFYSSNNAASEFTVWVARDENDTTLTGLTDSMALCKSNGFNAVNLNAFANDTVRIVFRLKGVDVRGHIDNIRIMNKYSLGYIPDNCFRNYAMALIPNAFAGDSIDYLHEDVLNTTQIIHTNSCIQSLEGLQYFVFLKYLNVSDNFISDIPSNPLYYLDSIDVSVNQLPFVPNMPICTRLNLNNNLIRKIPDIYNQAVSKFHARNNLIYDCLPGSNRFVSGDFYGNIQVDLGSFYYYSNPNYYINMPPITQCSQALGYLRGSVYFDMNQNGMRDPSDILITNQRINFTQGPDLYTNLQGYYSITTDTGFVNLNVTNLASWFICANPLADTLGFQETIGHDFRVEAASTVMDLQVFLNSSGATRLRENLTLIQTVRNIGTTAMSTGVKMYIPPGYTLVNLGQGTIVNDTLTWSTYLNPFGSSSNRIVMRIDSYPANQDVTFVSFLTVTDDNSVNNISRTKVLIEDSIPTTPPWGYPHDPNNKLVNTPVVNPGFNDYLEYNINFENTGTADATWVMVRDNLPSGLDYTTFDFIGSSHPCTISLGNDSLLQFLFYPITLTPTSVDSLNSQGHIWFRIKAKNPVFLNDTIINTAAVYFDTQPAVITGDCKVWADSVILAGISDQWNLSGVSVYPNPTTGFIKIKFVAEAEKNTKLILTDILGRPLKNEVVSTLNSKQEFQLDINDFPEGIYFLSIINSNQKTTSRIIKQ